MTLRDEQILLGEIDGELPAARRAALETSNAEILEALPPAMVAAEIERRLSRERREARRRRAVWSGAASVAVAAAILAVFWPRARDGVELAPEIVRVKGDPQLAIFRKEAGGVRRLRSSTPVRAGDELQLSYNAAGARHGVILSVDGRGVVTLHHPASAGASTELDRSGPVALGFAYRLDDAPGFERFFFLTSPVAIDAGETVRRFERWAASDRVNPATDRPPTDLRVRSILLRKAPQP